MKMNVNAARPGAGDGRSDVVAGMAIVADPWKLTGAPPRTLAEAWDESCKIGAFPHAQPMPKPFEFGEFLLDGDADLTDLTDLTDE